MQILGASFESAAARNGKRINYNIQLEQLFGRHQSREMGEVMDVKSLIAITILVGECIVINNLWNG